MVYNILTIEREFGTGGYEIGMQLSKLLQIPFYDQNKIRLILHHDNKTDRRQRTSGKTNPLLYGLVTHRSNKGAYMWEVDEETANKEFGVIRQLSEEGPCILLGRCANYILRNRSDVYSVFISGDQKSKEKRMRHMLGSVSSEDLLQQMEETDHARSDYYRHFTGRDWKDKEYYNAILTEGDMSEEEMILFLMNHMKKQAINI